MSQGLGRRFRRTREGGAQWESRTQWESPAQ